MEYLSNDELHSLLEIAKKTSHRDWLMILTGYWHGLRASEVVRLRAKDLADGHIDVGRLKGSARTVQPLVYDADPLFDEFTPLTRIAHNLQANERVFPINRRHFWRLMQKYGPAAGIARRKSHPHILKHSIAQHSIRKAGIENVRQYLGHKSLASTGSYLRVDDATASKAVLDALGAGRPKQMGLGFGVIEMPRRGPQSSNLDTGQKEQLTATGALA